jgi:hypothetical protein
MPQRMPSRKRCSVPWLIIAFLAAMIVVVFVLSLFMPAHGRDLDGAHAAAPLHDWFSNLRNGKGALCCEEADGHRLEDIDWRGEADGTYSVRVNEEWVKLQPEQVVKEPNRLGSAVIWIWQGHITCFMPGAGT